MRSRSAGKPSASRSSRVGLRAMAIIGIALVEIVLRDAVERGEQHLRLEIELRERRRGSIAASALDIDGIVVIGRGDAQASAASASSSARRTPCRRPSRWSRRNIGDRAARAGCGRSPPPAARRGARRSPACRSASPNRPRQRPPGSRPPAERVGELFGLRARDGLQRALVALLVPDRLVVLALAAAGARDRMIEIEDRPPQPARRLDDAPVGQEFLEIAPHRPIVGRLRRAEIDEQHADPPAWRRRDGRPGAASARKASGDAARSCRLSQPSRRRSSPA